MKTFFFITMLLMSVTFVTKAQTRKNGSPDMRYSSNKQSYGNYTAPTYTPKYSAPTYSAPKYSEPTYTPSKYSSDRPIYPGETHTESHNGDYPGSVNSHHKAGHYVNPNSNNRYGIHK